MVLGQVLGILCSLLISKFPNSSPSSASNPSFLLTHTLRGSRRCLKHEYLPPRRGAHGECLPPRRGTHGECLPPRWGAHGEYLPPRQEVDTELQALGFDPAQSQLYRHLSSKPPTLCAFRIKKFCQVIWKYFLPIFVSNTYFLILQVFVLFCFRFILLSFER